MDTIQLLPHQQTTLLLTSPLRSNKLHIVVHAHASLHLVVLALHDATLHCHIQLTEPHATANVHILTLLNQQQDSQIQLNITHQATHTNSFTLYKCILDQDAHADFTGKVTVQPAATFTDATQTVKCLADTKQNHFHASPQLEIYNDNVKCKHGISVGNLDPQQLFYLQSRGVPYQQAVNILKKAFANEVLEQIHDPIQKQLLTTQVDEKLSESQL
jgi:Fe-S cluster assembly protein SufD